METFCPCHFNLGLDSVSRRRRWGDREKHTHTIELHIFTGCLIPGLRCMMSEELESDTVHPAAGIH